MLLIQLLNCCCPDTLEKYFRMRSITKQLNKSAKLHVAQPKTSAKIPTLDNSATVKPLQNYMLLQLLSLWVR